MGQMNESNPFEKTFFRRTAKRQHQLLFLIKHYFVIGSNLWFLYESKSKIPITIFTLFMQTFLFINSI